MPQNRDVFLRYLQIDRELRHSHGGITKHMLTKKISWELNQRVTESTVEKDIYRMRYDHDLKFYAPIAVEINRGGDQSAKYYYDEEGYTILDHLIKRFQ